MIVIVSLIVKNFDALNEFEKMVAPILHLTGAKMLHAIEVKRNDNVGEEIHVIEFPNMNALETYKQKTNTDSINRLRSLAIENIDIKIELKSKYYV